MSIPPDDLLTESLYTTLFGPDAAAAYAALGISGYAVAAQVLEEPAPEEPAPETPPPEEPVPETPPPEEPAPETPLPGPGEPEPGAPPSGGGGPIVLPPVGTAPPTLPGIPGLKEIVDWISGRLKDLADFVDAIGNGVLGAIGTTLGALLPTALDLLAGLTEVWAWFSQALLDNLATAEELGSDVAKGLSAWADEHPPTTDTWFSRLLPKAMSNTLDEVSQRMALSLARDPLGAPLTTVSGMVEAVVRVVAAAMGAWGAVGQEEAQKANREHQQAIISPAEVVLGSRREWVSNEQYYDLLSRAGLPAWQAEILYRLTAQLFQPLELLELWRRGELSEDFVDGELQRIGYEGLRVPAIKALALTVANPSDLIRMMVREVFTPSIAEAFGQFQEFPPDSQPELEAEFRKSGVGLPLARNLWAAHWELPSLTQGYEMLHRTSDTPLDERSQAVELPHGRTVYRLISEDTLAALQRAQDVMPYWRRPLQAISYNPLTRIDVRRMRKVGELDYDGVVKAYLDDGYTLENAVRLANFTEIDVSGERRQEREIVTGPIKTRVISRYLSGRLSEEDARAALGELGYLSAQVDAFIHEARWVRETEHNDDIAAGVRKLYVAGQWAYPRVRDYLLTKGWEQGEIDDMVEAWTLARDLREINDAEKAQRDLTKSELLTGLRERIISERSVTSSLLGMGYSEAEARTLILLESAKLEAADRRDKESIIHSQYLARQLERPAVQTQLDNLGLPVAHRNALLYKWDAERASQYEPLPLPVIEAALAGKLIPEPVARFELGQRGFNPAQTDVILDVWKQ